MRKFWTRDVWEATCKPTSSGTSHNSDSFNSTKGYLSDLVGIDVGLMIDRSQTGRELSLMLNHGELGFFGPYLGADRFRITGRRNEQVWDLVLPGHYGEFRFDSGFQAIDELVVIVASNTLNKPPDTQLVLLGLETREGVSRRVGIGVILLSGNKGCKLPLWGYKLFRVQ